MVKLEYIAEEEKQSQAEDAKPQIQAILPLSMLPIQMGVVGSVKYLVANK
tara:strand:- start:3170 stop:3319 length:150 start_codon:yes stop_codon:yes gene_type:complete